MFDEKIKTIEIYFKELRRHAKILIGMNEKTEDFFEKNFKVYNYDIFVSALPRSHSEFTLHEIDLALENVLHTSEVMLNLIKESMKRMNS